MEYCLCVTPTVCASLPYVLTRGRSAAVAGRNVKMTLSSQLGASLGATLVSVPPAPTPPSHQPLQPVRVRKAASVEPPAVRRDADAQDGVDDSAAAPRWRRKLSSLIRSTGDLSAHVVHTALDETAVFVRTLSQRRSSSRRDRARRDRGDKLKSRWVSYTARSVDEETAAALDQDADGDAGSVFGEDGCSSGGSRPGSRQGSTQSLSEDAMLGLGGVAAPRALRRTLSFFETRCGPDPEPGHADGSHASGPGGGRGRQRSVSHAGQGLGQDFRRSMGSIPVEYAACAGDGLRRQHCPRHGGHAGRMHSAWSTSLSSLQEGVIADDLDGLRRSHDDVRRDALDDAGLDQVGGAVEQQLLRGGGGQRMDGCYRDIKARGPARPREPRDAPRYGTWDGGWPALASGLGLARSRLPSRFSRGRPAALRGASLIVFVPCSTPLAHFSCWPS